MTHPREWGAVHIVFFCVGWIFSLGYVAVASPHTMRDSQRSCTSLYVNGRRLPNGPHSCPLTGLVYPPCMEGVSLPWTRLSLFHTLLPRTFLPRTRVLIDPGAHFLFVNLPSSWDLLFEGLPEPAPTLLHVFLWLLGGHAPWLSPQDIPETWASLPQRGRLRH